MYDATRITSSMLTKLCAQILETTERGEKRIARKSMLSLRAAAVAVAKVLKLETVTALRVSNGGPLMTHNCEEIGVVSDVLEIMQTIERNKYFTEEGLRPTCESDVDSIA
ncbi:hypothetical protein NECAME_08055 [Necator americanus]|uniref:Uncharacterized protein n=1 Tax=Necator americanus TaxID=51031 RepID=W2TKC0_NECAM|nr:hypothetical protein NECAME_08055 [Necator americanus]ETN82233.1 hypothetical protein NECAME_08055 [Necator americanus]